MRQQQKFKTGFITPPWPHTRGDSVKALSIVIRILDEANTGCGLHYEIYHYRALRALIRVLDDLNDSDAKVFSSAADRMGFPLVTGELDESLQAYISIMNEIRSEQI